MTGKGLTRLAILLLVAILAAGLMLAVADPDILLSR